LKRVDSTPASVTAPATASDLSNADARSDARWRLLGRLFLGFVLALRVATFLDYGVTWDEATERRNGSLTVRWYASGMQDRAFLGERDQYLYGSLFNVLVRPICRHSPLGYYDTQHLLITLAGLLATVAAYATATHLAGPLAGLLAAVFLTLTPSFYGHSFNNPKDIPFAALYALAVLLLVRAVGRPLGYGGVAALGAAIGLLAGVRMIGLAILGLAVPLVILLWRRTPPRAAGQTRSLLRLALMLGMLCLLAWGVMLVWYPYVQLAPITHTWEVLRGSGHFSWWSRTTLFNGQEYRPGDLPRAYVPMWLAMTTPEFYLVALGCGALLLMSRLRALPPLTDTVVRVSVVLLAVVAPLAAAVVLRPVIYDGIRHLLFVLPALAALAGAALAFFVRRATRVWRIVVMALVVAGVAVTATDMVALHPYQYVYFNRLVGGGLPQAAGRFETDYWGVSYKEALRWLGDHYRFSAGPIRVANCSEEFLTAYELGKTDGFGQRFESVASMDSADVVLATTRWNCHRAQAGRVLHVVQRQGVGLCYVIERHAPAPAGPAATQTRGSS